MAMFTPKSVYLCGSMSNLKTYGTGWRKKLKKWFDERRVLAYDPCTEETKEHKKYDLAKTPKHCWEKLPHPLQEEIIVKDFRQIEEKTKYVVCFFTRFSTGTVSELSLALYRNLPVYFVTSRSLKGWPYTVSKKDGNKVFKTFDDLKRFLTVKYHLKRKPNGKSTNHDSRT